MRHDQAVERLSELLGVHPTSPDEAALRTHLASCSECQQRLLAIEYVERELRGFTAERPTESLEQAVLSIPDGPREQGQVRRARRVWLPAVASGVVVVVALALSLALARGGSSGEGFNTAHAITLTGAAAGVHARLDLGTPQGANQPLRLVASGLAPTGAPYYTLWLVADGRRVSAGTFRPDADGNCVVIGVVPRDTDWRQASITRSDNPPGTAQTVAAGSF